MVAAGLSASLSMPLSARSGRLIPQRPTARAIVDNDFAGDPDGLIALAHQLLAPKALTKLVTSSALDPQFTSKDILGASAEAGRALAAELVRKGKFGQIPVVVGAESFGIGSSQISPAAHAIVAEAMRDDPMPLFITCGGPLTNIAAALRLEPRIAERSTLVWIGGGSYPLGGWEYNLMTDLAAARQVIEESRIPIWQVPSNAYRQMQFSVAELGARLRSVSPFGRWLYERFTDPPSWMEIGGSWPMGDSPTVLLTAVSSETSKSLSQTARKIMDDGRYGEEIAGRPLKVFETLDARLAMEDFLSLVSLHRAGTKFKQRYP